MHFHKYEGWFFSLNFFTSDLSSFRIVLCLVIIYLWATLIRLWKCIDVELGAKEFLP